MIDKGRGWGIFPSWQENGWPNSMYHPIHYKHKWKDLVGGRTSPTRNHGLWGISFSRFGVEHFHNWRLSNTRCIQQLHICIPRWYFASFYKAGEKEVDINDLQQIFISGHTYHSVSILKMGGGGGGRWLFFLRRGVEFICGICFSCIKETVCSSRNYILTSPLLMHTDIWLPWKQVWDYYLIMGYPPPSLLSYFKALFL